MILMLLARATYTIMKGSDGMNGKKLIADLSNTKVKGYINRGNGITSEGVSQSDSGIVFDNQYSDANAFPMFAIDFSEYIADEDIRIQDVKAIEMVAIIYDEAGNEIDLSSEFQKCAFVSRKALDGYSTSDILPTGNYKVMGSRVITKFDLTKYTGLASDGKSPVMSTLEEGVGINIQILNGDYKKVRYLVISLLGFLAEEQTDAEKEESSVAAAAEASKTEEAPVVRATPEAPVSPAENILVADLSDMRIRGYENRGYGMSDEGVTQSEAGLEFEIIYSDLNAYPMFAVDFSEYLIERNVNIEDVESFDIVATLYDEKKKELDLSSEFQKCAFVSKEALDGFSDSDILPAGNYKQIGSGIVTTFDLTVYTGYKNDGASLTDSTLEEGVGFNIQVINGDHSQVRYLVVSSLVFKVKPDVEIQ